MTLLNSNGRFSVFSLPLFIIVAGVPMAETFLRLPSSLPCCVAAEEDIVAQDERDTTFYPPSGNPSGERLGWWRPDSAVNKVSATDSQGIFHDDSSFFAPAQGQGADSVSPEAAVCDSPNAAPLWLGCYGEGIRRFNEDNTPQGFVDVKIGRRIFNRIPTDLYAKIQGSRDIAGLAWNNRADAGLGLVAAPPIGNQSLSLFAEALIGNYIPSQRPSVQYMEGGRATDSLRQIQDSLQSLTGTALYGPTGRVTEIEVGAVFSKNWGADIGSQASKTIGLTFRRWGYVYSELVYSHLVHTYNVPRLSGLTVRFQDSVAALDNIVWYVNPKVGIELVNGMAGSISACAAVYAWIDTHRDWWNNKMWGGPLMRYRPFAAIDFILEAGYMIGGYDGISNASNGPNPYPKTVSTWQFGVYFDYSLGI